MLAREEGKAGREVGMQSRGHMGGGGISRARRILLKGCGLVVRGGGSGDSVEEEGWGQNMWTEEGPQGRCGKANESKVGGGSLLLPCPGLL